MNRPTAILVALAALLAHVLALHQDLEGAFAPPYELAHVAYRAARNLVYDGSLAWSTGGATIESYPSPLWVALSAALQLARVSPTVTSQYAGIACVLLTVIVLAQFSAHRLAGLIALLLFVVTGTTAAAAASGTEYPLVMLLVGAGFLAFERRWTRATAVLLALLVLARNDAGLFVLGLFAAELAGARRRRAQGERVLLRAFVAPAATWVLLVAARFALVGRIVSPTTLDLLELDPERARLGLDYVLAFYVRSGSGALLAFPAWYLVRGQLSGTGRRALFLVLLWSAFVALAGGDNLPFWMALAPALPLFFLAVQEAMILAMDSRRRGLAPATWVAFVLGVVASGLVSRVPANLGGLPLRNLQLAWMTPSDRALEAHGRMYGRLGLMHEIAETEELRALGVFLRDRLDLGTTILTPWPGAVGYVSRQHVVDLLGRASAPADGSRQRSWYGVPRLDVAACVASGADYVVPAATTGVTPPRIGEVVRRWVALYGETGDAQAASATLGGLRAYELVSVPVPVKSYRPEESSPRPFYLLRRKALATPPRVIIEEAGDGEFDVFAWHEGHQQVIDLEVELALDDGTLLKLRPTGEFVDSGLVHARAGILLHPIGQKLIHLIRFRLPPGVESGELRAVLQNPNSEEDPLFSLVSRTAVKRF